MCMRRSACRWQYLEILTNQNTALLTNQNTYNPWSPRCLAETRVPERCSPRHRAPSSRWSSRMSPPHQNIGHWSEKIFHVHRSSKIVCRRLPDAGDGAEAQDQQMNPYVRRPTMSLKWKNERLWKPWFRIQWHISWLTAFCHIISALIELYGVTTINLFRTPNTEPESWERWKIALKYKGETERQLSISWLYRQLGMIVTRLYVCC